MAKDTQRRFLGRDQQTGTGRIVTKIKKSIKNVWLTKESGVNYNRCNLSEKCYDREEYIGLASTERRWTVGIFVKDLWK